MAAWLGVLAMVVDVVKWQIAREAFGDGTWRTLVRVQLAMRFLNNFYLVSQWVPIRPSSLTLQFLVV
eukprot:SAG31_NODE_4319_length_3362_cov_2.182041_5_plen_67_part_00